MIRAILIASAATVLCIGSCAHVEARELTPALRKSIELINQRDNRAVYPDNVTWACQNYALAKANDLIGNGFSPSEIRLAGVVDDHGLGHEVAEVLGEVNGKPVTYVLDNHSNWLATRAELETAGYHWQVEMVALFSEFSNSQLTDLNRSKEPAQ